MTRASLNLAIDPSGSSGQSWVRFRSERICVVRNGIGVPAAGGLPFLFLPANRASSCWYLCWYRQPYKKTCSFNSIGYGTR